MTIRPADLPLILVSGQARSGTTVLTKAIAAHPQVYSNGKENNWLRDLALFLKGTLDDPSRVRQMSVSPEVFQARFRETAYELLFPDTSQVGAEVRAVSTFSSLREDMFDAIAMLFPNWFLVNIIRNGIEVVASRMQHASIGPGRDFSTHCVAWSHAADVVRWADELEDKDRFFLVRHEQLLNPDSCREVFKALQLFLKLDDSPACERFVEMNFVSRNKGNASPQTEQGVLKRKDLWKEWTDEQRRIFNEICCDSMEYFGYPIPW
jgi:predicted ATPase